MAVGEVQIVGSQPWPIGRYGSCELMLGCVAKAASYEIMVNTGEVRFLWRFLSVFVGLFRFCFAMGCVVMPGRRRVALGPMWSMWGRSALWGAERFCEL